MGKTTGFLDYGRERQPYRPVTQRLQDWRQVMEPWVPKTLNTQAARCMDCGIPFCHQGCPLGNLIPDWNDLVYQEKWQDAIKRLHATNNFPEFTGSLCPAPCEGACVLDLHQEPVTIKAIELAIIERAWEEDWIVPEIAPYQTNKTIAIVGSGPAGLAAAQQLSRAGHTVTVMERSDRLGGLLRYGIPEFKMEKQLLDRRLKQMEAEGVVFKTNLHVGVDISASELKTQYDVVLLAGGACAPRDLMIEGRTLDGIHQAMTYLTLQNRRCEGDTIDDKHFISAENKHVVIIGGGDTGADCLGTANRQGAASVHQLEIMAMPGKQRATDNPWPEWPKVFRISSAHEEGCERLYAVSTKRFVGEDHVQALDLVEVVPDHTAQQPGFKELPETQRTLPADLVLLAMGFSGPEKQGLLTELDIALDERGNVICDQNWMTNHRGIFAAGDMQHGQSLIVWAIAEGRSAARCIDRYLMGHSDLPAPL